MGEKQWWSRGGREQAMLPAINNHQRINNVQHFEAIPFLRQEYAHSCHDSGEFFKSGGREA